MRDFKFRAWDSKESKWLFDSPEGFSMFGEMVIMGEWGNAAWRSIVDGEPSRYVLQQYTGLKDKNGVEIYEGDIVVEVSGVSGRIIWGHGDNEWLGQGAGWILVTRGDAESWIELEAGVSAHGEVIGNIYENPKLLEQTNEV